MSTGVQIAMDIALQFEGFAEKMPDGRYMSYWDKDGKKWTIGIGCTGPDIIRGTIWTHDQCLSEFKRRMLNIANQAQSVFPKFKTFTPNQQGAIIDFIYNCGYGLVMHNAEHLKAAILAERWQEASVLIKQFNRSGGVVLAGLTKRRAVESRLLTK